jgi:hypothetical protein
MSTKTFKGFGGGITDFYIDAQPNQYAKADNLLVDQYENLINRPGTELDFDSSYTRARVPSTVNTRRIGLLMDQKVGANANFTLMKQAGHGLYYDDGTQMQELVGPGSASAFDLTVPVTSQTAFSYTNWNDHTIITHEGGNQRAIKVYRDNTGALRLRTAGLPPTANTFTATGGSGASYIYALVLAYTYKVGDVEYIDRSRPVLKEFTNIGTATPSSSPAITVGSIPVLANTNGQHYDTTAIKVEVYRTKNNGTTLYKSGEVTNGTTTYSDTVTDNALDAGLPLYTSGGEIANDRPPVCKYVHATSDFCYWANGIEVSITGADLQLLPQRFWQSKRGDPDSVPASFFADIEEPIIGISSIRSIPIVFGATSTYRIDGNVDNFGRGSLLPRKISDSVGCVGQLSIVQTNDGLFFASNDGFYFTDGYKVQKLSNDFQDTYNKLVSTSLNRKRIYGAYNIAERFVYWATEWEDNNEGPDNRRLFVLNLDNFAFTTFSSGYNGAPIEEELTGTIVSNTITGLSDTTKIQPGQYVVAEGLSPETYVVSVDSFTQITISPTPASSPTSFKFLKNDENAVFYNQFRPSSILYANSKLFFGQVNGYTKVFNPDISFDLKVDDSLSGSAAVNFKQIPILWDYRGPADSLGTTEYRKWVNGIVIKARPRFNLTSDVTIQPLGENNDAQDSHKLEYILFQPFYPWGSQLVPYGDPRLYRRRSSMVDVKRRFPAGKMRCQYKQVQLRTAFIKKYESDRSFQAAVAGSGQVKTFTILGGIWPNDIVDYWVKLDFDDYTSKYRILSRDSATQISILDEDDTLLAGTYSWAIFAYLKTNLIQLLEYSVYYVVLGTSQDQYTGENKVNDS